MNPLIVYVKHYLTRDGIDYFKNEWFPKVVAFMREQAGYLSCTYAVSGDCVDITIKFNDEPSFDAYVKVPEHHQLAKLLDSYRSKNYWKAVRTLQVHADPSTLKWDLIDPANY